MAPSGGQGADTLTGHAQHVDFAFVFLNLAHMGQSPLTTAQPNVTKRQYRARKWLDWRACVGAAIDRATLRCTMDL